MTGFWFERLLIVGLLGKGKVGPIGNADGVLLWIKWLRLMPEIGLFFRNGLILVVCCFCGDTNVGLAALSVMDYYLF